MALEDDFYIAWDGREYAGIPPEGWFLAADNRWWPPRELIDGDDAVGQSPEDPLPDPSTSTSLPSAGPPVTGPPAGAPPTDWAPTTGSPAEEPQPPTQWGPAGSGQRKRKRGKQSKFRLGPVLFFFFILSRCNLTGDSQDVVVTPTPIDEIGFVEATADDFTGTNECSRTFLSGSISNANDFPQTFLVTTDRQDGGPDYQSVELPIEAGDTRSWVINLSDADRSGDFCPPVIVWIGP